MLRNFFGLLQCFNDFIKFNFESIVGKLNDALLVKFLIYQFDLAFFLEFNSFQYIQFIFELTYVQSLFCLQVSHCLQLSS